MAKDWGGAIKHFREATEMTVEGLAEKMDGMDASTVRVIEDGKREITYDEELAFADALGVPYGHLLGQASSGVQLLRDVDKQLG